MENDPQTTNSMPPQSEHVWYAIAMKCIMQLKCIILWNALAGYINPYEEAAMSMQYLYNTYIPVDVCCGADSQGDTM